MPNFLYQFVYLLKFYQVDAKIWCVCVCVWGPKLKFYMGLMGNFDVVACEPNARQQLQNK
jgi:hypothetical protein